MPNRNFPKGEVVRFRDRFLAVLRRCHWPSLVSGAAIGFAALHFQTTQPLLTQLQALEQRIAVVDSRMSQLAGAAHGAAEADNLLNVLTRQREQVPEARNALHALTDLQRTLTVAANETDEARIVADRWQELAERLVASQQQLVRSTDAIAEIDAVQQDVAALGAAAANAQAAVAASRAVFTDVANLQLQLAATAEGTESARAAVGSIEELQQRLVATAEQTPAARQAAAGLTALQQSLADVEITEAARGNAERLIALQQSLSADPRLQLEAAAHNAEQMLKLQESLSGQAGHIAASVENLELLADFQDELTAQLGRVESLRRQLTEFLLLETALSRTMSALAPLTDLGNLHRLDDAEVREVARTMLDRRRERVAAAESKYDTSATPTAEPRGEDRLVPEPTAE